MAMLVFINSQTDLMIMNHDRRRQQNNFKCLQHYVTRFGTIIVIPYIIWYIESLEEASLLSSSSQIRSQRMKREIVLEHNKILSFDSDRILLLIA